MFSKFFLVASLIALASAWSSPEDQCSTGSVQCCTSTTSDVTPQIEQELKGQGWTGGQIPTPVGLGCFSTSLIDILGGGCNAQPVCCENNSYNGLVVVGCSPISVL